MNERNNEIKKTRGVDLREKKISFKEALKKTGYGALSDITINNKILIVNPKK